VEFGDRTSDVDCNFHKPNTQKIIATTVNSLKPPFLRRSSDNGGVLFVVIFFCIGAPPLPAILLAIVIKIDSKFTE